MPDSATRRSGSGGFQKRHLLRAGILCICATVAGIAFSPAWAQQDEPMSVFAEPPNPGMKMILGTAWTLYLKGTIDGNSARKLEDFIGTHKVPREVFC